MKLAQHSSAHPRSGQVRSRPLQRDEVGPVDGRSAQISLLELARPVRVGPGYMPLQDEFPGQHQAADWAAGQTHVHLEVMVERLLGAEPLRTQLTLEHLWRRL